MSWRRKAAAALSLAVLFSLNAGSNAAAASFTTGEGLYPALLSGTQGELGAGEHRFEFHSGSVFCAEATFSGSISASSESILLEPTYKSCTTELFPSIVGPATVINNGCNYRLSVSGSPSSGSVDLICPSGSVIEFRLYTNAENHALNKMYCVYRIGNQTGVGSVAYENEATSPERLHATASGELIRQTIGSPAPCGPGGTKGQFTGEFFVSAAFEEGPVAFMTG